MINFRRARIEDAEDIHRVNMTSIRELCTSDYTKEEIEAWGGRTPEKMVPLWRERVQKDFCIVAEKSGVVEGIGVLALPKEAGKPALIYMMYLTKAISGTGSGKKMMKMMLDHAKENGVKEVVLESSLTAHGFYESLGFCDSGAAIKKEINGTPIRCVPMKIKINPPTDQEIE